MRRCSRIWRTVFDVCCHPTAENTKHTHAVNIIRRVYGSMRNAAISRPPCGRECLNKFSNFVGFLDELCRNSFVDGDCFSDKGIALATTTVLSIRHQSRVCCFRLPSASMSVSPVSVTTRRPASADRTARRQFQATGQPVSRTQASDAMTSRLPRYEAKIVLSDNANCTVLCAVVLTLYRRVTDGRTGRQTDRQTELLSTALVMRALRRRAVKRCV